MQCLSMDRIRCLQTRELRNTALFKYNLEAHEKSEKAKENWIKYWVTSSTMEIDFEHDKDNECE